jgi:hypothetical protein
VMNQRRLNGWCGRVRHAPSSAIPQMIVAQITPTERKIYNQSKL